MIFHMAVWNPDYADPMTFLDMFESKHSHNQMSFSDPKYDDMIKKSWWRING